MSDENVASGTVLEGGIAPIAPRERVLGFLDFFVLWGNLGIGLLVMLAGTFLVPGLGLGPALWAIATGGALGCLLLASTGAIAARTGLPAMALLRPALGVRGSYLPSVLNIIQLAGWTVFEFVVMGVAADALCRTLFGFSNYAVCTVFFALGVMAMGLGGPVGVVRQWLKKIAVWVALATGVWLTWHILSRYGFRPLLARAGDGSLSFWGGVDMVIALPASWLPLVADYNRFGKKPVSAFWGSFLGLFITNSWFLALGAMLLLGAGVAQEAKDFSIAIAAAGGWWALLILLADETHNAWADLYSSAVSAQNLFPRASQKLLVAGLGVVCLGIALSLDITRYQSFLYLIGSLFVPLFGLLAADYFVVRKCDYDTGELSRRGGAYWYRNGFNLSGLLVWLAGCAAYHLCSPATIGAFCPVWGELVPGCLGFAGGSLPSFIAAFLLRVFLREEPGVIRRGA